MTTSLDEDIISKSNLDHYRIVVTYWAHLTDGTTGTIEVIDLMSERYAVKPEWINAWKNGNSK